MANIANYFAILFMNANKKIIMSLIKNCFRKMAISCKIADGLRLLPPMQMLAHEPQSI